MQTASISADLQPRPHSVSISVSWMPAICRTIEVEPLELQTRAARRSRAVLGATDRAVPVAIEPDTTAPEDQEPDHPHRASIRQSSSDAARSAVGRPVRVGRPARSLPVAGRLMVLGHHGSIVTTPVASETLGPS